MRMMNYILEKSIDPTISEAIFHIYSNEATHRLSLNLFKKLVDSGSKINGIYLKLKYRYGGSNSIWYNFKLIIINNNFTEF